MLIRAALPADAPALAQIQVDSYRTAYAGLLPPAYLAQFSYAEQTQDWRDLLAAPTVDRLLVAETDGQIVAYVLGRPGPNAWPPCDAEIVALHVRAACQRQGIGRRLLTAMAGELRQAGCTAVMLSVLEGNTAQAFYRKLGGQELGRQQVQLDEDVFATEVVFGWRDIGSL